jgi:hypothetical protein
MTTGQGRGQQGNQHQYNTPQSGGTVYAAQGNQNIHHTTINAVPPTQALRRPWAGRALLITIAVDVAFFFYGMIAYTGHPNDTGDLWRAGIFLGLMVTTGTMLRRWLRRYS